MGLLGSVFLRQNRMMLWLLVLTIATGTLLVYPKHYTFHTPWIQAAYVLAVLFGAGVWMLKKFPQNRWVSHTGYVFLMILLIGIIHDAVTKTAFWSLR